MYMKKTDFLRDETGRNKQPFHKKNSCGITDIGFTAGNGILMVAKSKLLFSS